MKFTKPIVIIILLTPLILLRACFIFVLIDTLLSRDPVLESIGKYKDYDVYSEGVFQDFTDYGKFYYVTVDFADNKYFSPIQSSDLEVLSKYLNNFESWIETLRQSDASQEIVINYDFDRSIIDTEDYLYIESKNYDGYSMFAHYNIYFFDTQTKILYYFHQNI